METADYELIKSCLSGQKEAFKEIVTGYKKLVYNVIYNCIGRNSEASDLSQEAFIRVYRSLGSYNPEYRFATWLIKITINVCRDWITRNKNAPALWDAANEVRDSRSGPEEDFINRDELTRVRKAVSELPEKYRLPVVLFHQQGLSYKELEKVLGQPESIIKNRLYRARLMLRNQLNPGGEAV